MKFGGIGKMLSLIMYNWKNIVVPVFLLVASNDTMSQADSLSQPLSEVLVTAQRQSAEWLKVPYPVEIKKANDINMYQPRSTPEALQGMNGVFVQKTNHGGGSAFVRGLTGNQVLILVDGIRLNNATFRYGPNQYLNTISPYIINRVEVVRGSGSVQYGSDALGGVIQVLTREPEFASVKSNWKGTAGVKWMSAGMEQTGRGSVQYSTEKMAVIMGVTTRSFGDLQGGDTTGKQSPSGYDETSWDAKFKFLLSKNITLTIAHQWLNQSGVPVYHKVQLENFRINTTDRQQRMLNYAKLEIDGKSNWNKQLSITASLQSTEEKRSSQKNNSNRLTRESDKLNTLGLTTDLHSEFSQVWSANSGIELYHDKVLSTKNDINIQENTSTSLRGLYPDGATYGNYSIYSLHHLQWNKFSVESGLRYNFFDIKIADTTLGAVSLRPAAFVGNVAFMFNLSSKQKLYASVSNGYRAPNIDDMGSLGIVDFRFEVPTYQLQPEKSVNTEIGYKMQSTQWTISAALFYTSLRNQITRVKVAGDSINGYPVYRKENSESGHIKGIEMAMAYKPFAALSIEANMAYTYGQNETRQEPMRRIPPLNGRAMANYRKQHWHTSLEWLYAGKQVRLAQGDKDDNRIPRGGTPAWNVINFYAGVRWPQLNINCGLQNILNDDYRTHGSGINGVGRSVWVNVEYGF